MPWETGFGPVADGTYYVTLPGDSLTKLCALDVATGKVRWQVDLPGRQMVNPVIANNRLYFSAIKGGYWTVIALDSASGAQKWEYRMGDKLVAEYLQESVENERRKLRDNLSSR